MQPLTVVHRRRLREVWRSSGWPCRDMVEVELLAAGWLERVRDDSGHETLRVTDAGIALLADTLARNRAARDAHEALVERVATEMTRAGRIAWRGLALRAKVGDDWAMAIPDVFSIRHTTVEDYLEPVVHEIKVRRADLLADVKRESKRAAYLQLAGECWYVIREGIADAGEIPEECGVMVAREAGGALDVLRPAPRRPLKLPFAAWMALARSTPVPGWQHDGGVARTAPLLYLMPPVAGLVAWLSGGEHYTVVKLGGAVLALGGVGLAQYAAGARHDPVRESVAPVD